VTGLVLNEIADFQDAKVTNSHCLPREIAKLIFHRVNLKLLQRRKSVKGQAEIFQKLGAMREKNLVLKIKRVGYVKCANDQWPMTN